MILLLNWHLTANSVFDCQAHGVVYGHDRLEDDSYIHTSTIEQLKHDPEKACLYLETYSGSHYLLPLAGINPERMSATENSLSFWDIPKEILEVCTELLKQSEEERLARIKDIVNLDEILGRREKAEAELLARVEDTLGRNELYLQMSGIHTLKAFYRSGDGELYPVEQAVHVGMFQDSYLFILPGKVDFRYWDLLGGIESYCWSDGLEAVWIENKGRHSFSFQRADGNILCGAGQVTKIPKCPDGSNKMLFDIEWNLEGREDKC